MSTQKPSSTGAVDQRTPPVFRQLLANTLATGIASTFLWFALTFSKTFAGFARRKRQWGGF